MLSIFETIVVVIALSLDVFFSSFAYGTNKIRIPVKIGLAINIICTLILSISIYFGVFINDLINSKVISFISFLILFTLGIIKLLDSIIKNLIRKYEKRKIKFSFLSLKFVLSIYANPEKADVDHSKDISFNEAIPLAVALSIDGIIAGIGIGFNSFKYIHIILLSLILGMTFILLGCYLGNKASKKAKFDLSWISGLILIVLSLLRI